MVTESHTKDKASFQTDEIYGDSARALKELKLNSSFAHIIPPCFKVDHNYINYFSGRSSSALECNIPRNSDHSERAEGVSEKKWAKKAFCKKFVTEIVKKISKISKNGKNSPKSIKSGENSPKSIKNKGKSPKPIKNGPKCPITAAATMFYKVAGFPAPKHHIELNGNYVPVGTNAGRPFLVNRHFVYLFFKGGTWRLGTRLWVDEVIGYTRGDAVEGGKSLWNVVDNEGGYCTVAVTIEKGAINRKNIANTDALKLKNWYFEPSIIEINNAKRVAVRLCGENYENKTCLLYRSNFVAKRVNQRRFVTIDGKEIEIEGPLCKTQCKRFFKPDEVKFLSLFQDGFPANFMRIIELLI